MTCSYKDILIYFYLKIKHLFMAPKPKESAAPKKQFPTISRPPISDSSLLYVPEDVLEGFQERIESGIDWCLPQEAARYHKKLCCRDEIPTITFSEALQNKTKNSILNGFLNENLGLTLQEQWELLLPITLWDNEKFSNEEGKVCFRCANCITDDLIKLIKKAVKFNDRDILKRELKLVTLLRVNGAEMTELDKELTEYKKLVTLNLCGNFLKTLDASVLSPGLRALELQANRIKDVKEFAENLPSELLYLGLSRNFLDSGTAADLFRLPHSISVLDLTDNDIYDLEPVLHAVVRLPNLTSLSLAGNPCSVCTAYARTTLTSLPRLQWLDSREILPTDRPIEPFEPHPDDLRSSFFFFTVFRIISAPVPPKPEKGAVTAFYVEIELPLLDSMRRQFLMYRPYEDLIQILPPPEDEEWQSSKTSTDINNHVVDNTEESSSTHPSDIYNHLVAKNSRVIRNYKVFESNKVQWTKMMTFQEPTVKIFCPDLERLRDTFRTVVTVRFIYSVSLPTKHGKQDKKSTHALKLPSEQMVTLATIKCALKNPDWSQNSQHFHWDDKIGSDEAMHWGDGDLAIIQYNQAPVKTTKGKPDSDVGSSRQLMPENLTCHFGFGIETLRIF